jgi:recombination protein RecA
MGVDYEIIQKSGAWYSYAGAKIAQGRESAKQFLIDNPEVAHELELKIKEKLLTNPEAIKIAPKVAAADDDDDED